MNVSSTPFKLILGFIVVVLLGCGMWFGRGVWGKQGRRDGLYAVFLTNNQVYFGTINREDRSKVLLTNIYYIQMKDQNAASASDISLMKLGNELHGPEDQMEINRDHVLFIEKLKPDGRVAKAIADYKPTP